MRQVPSPVSYRSGSRYEGCIRPWPDFQNEMNHQFLCEPSRFSRNRMFRAPPDIKLLHIHSRHWLCPPPSEFPSPSHEWSPQWKDKESRIEPSRSITKFEKVCA